MSSSSSSSSQKPLSSSSAATTANSSSSSSRLRSSSYYRKQSSSLDVVLFVPNLLGYIRIGLALLSLVTAISGGIGSHSHSQQRPVATVMLWLISSSLDLFDGILARKLHQTSTLGIYVDIAADNVLRTTVWIIAAVTAAHHNQTMSTASSTTIAAFSSSLHLLIPAWIISLEWCTMICTQLQARRQQQQQQQLVHSLHWKEQHQQEPTHPYWIRSLFRNNFRNPLGIWAIYGLFGANMLWYASYHAVLYQQVPYFVVWKYLAYAGRVLSMSCEIYLIQTFIITMQQQQWQIGTKEEQQEQEEKEDGSDKKKIQ